MLIGILKDIQRGMAAIVLGTCGGLVLAFILILLIDHFFPAVQQNAHDSRSGRRTLYNAERCAHHLQRHMAMAYGDRGHFGLPCGVRTGSSLLGCHTPSHFPWTEPLRLVLLEASEEVRHGCSGNLLG